MTASAVLPAPCLHHTEPTWTRLARRPGWHRRRSTLRLLAQTSYTSLYAFKFSVTLSSNNGVAKNGLLWGKNVERMGDGSYGEVSDMLTTSGTSAAVAVVSMPHEQCNA